MTPDRAQQPGAQAEAESGAAVRVERFVRLTHSIVKCESEIVFS